MSLTKVISADGTQLVFSLEKLDNCRYSAIFYRPDNAETQKYQLHDHEISAAAGREIDLSQITDDEVDSIVRYLQQKFVNSTNKEKSTRNSSNVDKSCISFPIIEERITGDVAFKNHDFRMAVDIFGDLLSKNPQDPICQLDVSRTLLVLAQFEAAVEGFKRVISLVRRRKRHGSTLKSTDAHIPADLNQRDISETLKLEYTEDHLCYAAYAGMGAAFQCMLRASRAITCYVLALKNLRPNLHSHGYDIVMYRPLPKPPPTPPPSNGSLSLSPHIPPQDTNEVSSQDDGLVTINAEEELHALMQAHNTSVGRSVGDGTKSILPPDTQEAPVSSTIEIEEALSLHSLKALQDPFSFSCTMCGECCRTSDNIMLTPQDIFDMTRSPAMQLFGISGTEDLLSHDYFKGVFHYTRRLGYPVCYLRPQLEVDKRGHCYFAYPLYTTSVTSQQNKLEKTSRTNISAEYEVYSPDTDCAKIDSPGNGDVSGSGVGKENRSGTVKSESRQLITFEEYFDNVLSKEIAEDATQTQARTERYSRHDSEENDFQEYTSRENGVDMGDSSESGGDDGGNGGGSVHTSDSDDGSDSNDEMNWNGVINSVGRQALGCMLGVSNMPTMCRSYPIAPELSQADFWHVRRTFWRERLQERKSVTISDETMTGVGSNGGMAGRRLAPGWQMEEQYVVVNAPACEGFRAAASASVGDDLTPIRNGVYVSPSEETCESGVKIHREEDGLESKSSHTSIPTRVLLANSTAPDSCVQSRQTESMAADNLTGNSDVDDGDGDDGPSTVKEFVGDELLSRWEETQWFLAMIEDINTHLPTELIVDKDMLLVYVNRLAQLWYNFDSLHCAKSRPFRSYRRLKRDIESLTWVLVKETRKFLESDECSVTSPPSTPDSSSQVVKAYESLLQRLNIA